jgi:predicted RNA-binding Zn-ribbon protein involved in translation (DUF1610 family)
MPKIKLTCAACGHEVERIKKNDPKKPKEFKQVYFLCPSCGAANLRDGSARPTLKKDTGPVGSKTAGDKETLIQQKEDNPGPVLKTKEISHGNETETDDSWLIL